MITRLTFKTVAAFGLAAVLATAATAITVQSGDAARAAFMGVDTPFVDLLDAPDAAKEAL
ncbi:hypothetical protein BH11PSE7_BH11PSE7_37950 [soil metagenome]